MMVSLPNEATWQSTSVVMHLDQQGSRHLFVFHITDLP